MAHISDYKIHDTVKVVNAPQSVDGGVVGSTGNVCQIFKDAELLLIDCGKNLGAWYLSPNEIQIIK